MTPRNGLPIGIYDRVSRKGDREDERFHSPKEQRERATALVLGRGLTPGKSYSDIDVSGATHPDARPAMRELLAAIERGELGGIAAYSLDRLSREPAHGDELVKRVTKAGGVILTPDIPDAIDSPTGEFTFGMLLQVAKLYRSQAGARFSAAKVRAILAGIPVGPTPIGYRQGVDRRLELDPVDAPVVRELFERRAAGESLTVLARRLTEHTGRLWTREGTRSVIRRRLYATGRLEYGELVSDHDAGAIVDEPLWHAAQLAQPAPRPPRSDARWLLTGLLKCAACGRNLRPHSSAERGNGQRYRRYRCIGGDCPARPSVAAERIETWARLAAFTVGDEMVTRATEAPDLARLEEALARAERLLAQVMMPDVQEALGAEWAALAKARRVARDEAAAELGAARHEAGTPEVDFRLRDVWDDLSAEDRRGALHLIWREIRLGAKAEGGWPITFVRKGGHAGEVEAELPTSEGPA